MPPPGSFAEQLDALAGLLDGADLDALDTHKALRRQLHGETDADTATALDAAMTALDFDTALMLCRRVRATLEPRP
ncbi:MAG: hypothetical protein HY020_19840 [Burkholderiales bacterium]|nr:hypothetical protein [Burkholderiales bacterium]